MRRILLSLLFIPCFFQNAAMAEEPKYKVIVSDGDFEVRLYEPYIVAETIVDTTDWDEASNEGFRRLAGYIFGGNTVKQKISMTAPVTTERSQKIAMTAPVETNRQGSSVVVRFMMPSEWTLETLPKPNDPRVVLRSVSARKLAVIEFSGRWTSDNFREHTEELRAWITAKGFTTAGDPIEARYNAPFIPSFLRHNEVLIPVE